MANAGLVVESRMGEHPSGGLLDGAADVVVGPTACVSGTNCLRVCVLGAVLPVLPTRSHSIVRRQCVGSMEDGMELATRVTIDRLKAGSGTDLTRSAELSWALCAGW